MPWQGAVVIGVALGLSSTAVVAKLLRARGEENTPTGHTAISILVSQDVVAVLALAAIPALGGNTEGSLAALFTTLALGLVAVTLLGRLLLHPFFRIIQRLKDNEVFTAAALFSVLAIAWVGHLAHLSLPLGAFLAGVCLAESKFSYLVQSELAPFRWLFLSLFFISVGLSVDLAILVSELDLILLLTLVMMLMKWAATSAAARLTRLDTSPSIRVGAILSQASEFSFVMVQAALAAGLLDARTGNLLTVVIGLSLVLTPAVASAGCILSRSCGRLGSTDLDTHETSGDTTQEVIIAGFDEEAWVVASKLQEAGIPYRGHDRDWDKISSARSRGFNVHYSDITRPRTVSRAVTGQVRAVVNLIQDPEVAKRLLSALVEQAPEVPVFSATNDLKLFETLEGVMGGATFTKNDEGMEALTSSLFRALKAPLPATVTVRGSLPELDSEAVVFAS